MPPASSLPLQEQQVIAGRVPALVTVASIVSVLVVASISTYCPVPSSAAYRDGDNLRTPTVAAP